MPREELLRLLGLTVVFAGSLALSWHLWSATLESEWAVSEDHHIHAALGADGKISWREVGELLRGSEAGRPGESPRYRPFYFGLRLVEAKLWGGDVRTWYLARIVLFASMLAAAWLALARFTGLALAAAGTALLAQGPYWADIFARLGTAAAYAAPGLALSALGCAWLWRPDERASERARATQRRVAWLLAGGGATVAIGAKENLAFLPAFLLLVAWHERQRGRLGRWGWVATLVPTALAALVVGALLAYFVHTPIDLYGQPIVGAAAWESTWTQLASRGWRAFVPLGVVGLAASTALVLRRRPSRDRLARRLLALAAWEAGLLLVVVSQIYVYRERWNPVDRYAFPGETFLLLAGFLPLALAVRALARCERVPARLRRALPGATAAMLLAAVLQAGFARSRNWAAAYQATTRHYSGVFRAVARAASADPAAVIAVRSRSVVEIEGAISAEALLRFYGVINPIVAARESGGLEPGWANEALAAELLSQWKDLWGGHYASFAPQAVLEQARSCLEVAPIAAPQGTLGCTSFGVAWRRPRAVGAVHSPRTPPEADGLPRPRRSRRPPRRGGT